MAVKIELEITEDLTDELNRVIKLSTPDDENLDELIVYNFLINLQENISKGCQEKTIELNSITELLLCDQANRVK